MSRKRFVGRHFVYASMNNSCGIFLRTTQANLPYLKCKLWFPNIYHIVRGANIFEDNCNIFWPFGVNTCSKTILRFMLLFIGCSMLTIKGYIQRLHLLNDPHELLVGVYYT